jgi:glycosyltransferase involved in cell wall biosynthesis
MKILFILSKILGNATSSKNILSIVNKLPDIEATVFYFDYDDYNVAVPKYLLKVYRSSYIVRKKVEKAGLKNEFNLIVFSSFHLTPCFEDWICTTPSIVSHDQTPASSFELIKLEDDTLQTRISCNLKNLLNHIVYRKVLKKIRVFMPWTRFCADSLINEYRVPKNKIIVSPGYVDDNGRNLHYTMRNFSKKELLFVGNDFKRKGGFFLLEIMEILGKSYQLTIVTNDNSIEKISILTNVKILNGYNSLEKLFPVYESATLFVFPTKREQMGVVLMEAAVTGLPVIVTDIGGVSEIVKHNETGLLMTYKSTANDWAAAIEHLYAQQDLLITYSASTLKLAQEKFSKDAYGKLLSSAFSIALEN